MMDLSIILIFVVVLLVSLLLTRRHTNLPPGYFGIPFLGSLLLLRKLRGKRPHVVLFEESKRLGNVYRWYIGNQLIVVLSGYDVIHEALVNKADAFSDRPVVLSDKLFPRNTYEHGIISSEYGQCWRELRRFTLQALRDFGVGKASIEEKIQVETEMMVSLLQDSNGKPTSINDLMQKVIANVIFGIIFGKRYDYDDPEFDRVRNLTHIVVSGEGAASVSNFMPKFLAKLVNRKDAVILLQRTQSVLDMRKYVFAQIEEHEATFDQDNIRAFVDIYIQADKQGDESMRKFITKGNIFRVIFDLFLAGSETTSTTLDWAFLLMTEFPDVQKKCQDEIEVLGDKSIEYTDRNKLIYVNATIMEIQRYSNIVPLNVMHWTRMDTTLAGYNIPAGTMIMPSIYSISMDSKYFQDPAKFAPERFIDHSGNLIKNDALVPFSLGPRTCLGEPLARMELFLIFANLVQQFEFRRENPDIAHTLESKLGQITNAPATYKLRANKRV